MSSLALLFVIAAVAAFTGVVLSRKKIDEPVCTSRYDFESSLLRDMLKLELGMSVLKEDYGEDITSLKDETKLAAEKLEVATRKLEESQDQAVSELTALGETQKKASDDKIQELEAAKTLLQDDFNTRISALELQMEKKLDEIRAVAIKRPVAFLVKTLSDTTSGANKVLKFTESIWNTNNVYDSNTGYFTAPVNGTYIFNLQLCYHKSNYVHAQMVADSAVIANAILYESTGGIPCTTLSAVAVLAKDGRVCARLGIDYSKGGILYQDETNRWAAFMGALVN